MSQYESSYYKRYKNFNHARLADFIIKDLRPFISSMQGQRARLIADIGCGTGRIASALKQYSKISIGVDASSCAINMADKNGTVFFIRGSAIDAPLKSNICDICLCIHVIEHIKEYDMLLKEIYRITADNGRVVFITPNRKWARFSPWFLKDKTHVKEFTADELKKAVSNYFHVEKTRPFSMFTSFWALNPLLNWLFKPDIYMSCVKI